MWGAYRLSIVILKEASSRGIYECRHSAKEPKRESLNRNERCGNRPLFAFGWFSWLVRVSDIPAGSPYQVASLSYSIFAPDQMYSSRIVPGLDLSMVVKNIICPMHFISSTDSVWQKWSNALARFINVTPHSRDQREWVFEVREVKSEKWKLSLFFEKCKTKKKCFHSFPRSEKWNTNALRSRSRSEKFSRILNNFFFSREKRVKYG